MAEPGDAPLDEAGELPLAQVAARAGVSPGTVRRWVARGLVPGYDGSWTPAAAAYVRVVARLRLRTLRATTPVIRSIRFSPRVNTRTPSAKRLESVG